MSSPLAIAAGDFNGDGIPDLALSTLTLTSLGSPGAASPGKSKT